MADKEVDKKVSKQMSSLIELLTTSGKSTLNPEIMKKFKKICRTSDMHITHAHELLLMQLTKNHSEIRLSTFQMIDELFNRSHAFRLLILQDFHTLLELSVGTDTSLPIPPPKSAAKVMKIETCRSIQQWYDKFKEGYPKLVLGYEFLKSTKKVDFDEFQAQAEQERQIKEDRERKLEQARKDKLEKVEKEIRDGKMDIELVVTEVENGLELLMPHPDNFFIGSSSPTSSEMDRNYPLPSSSQSFQNNGSSMEGNYPLPSSSQSFQNNGSSMEGNYPLPSSSQSFQNNGSSMEGNCPLPSSSTSIKPGKVKENIQSSKLSGINQTELIDTNESVDSNQENGLNHMKAGLNNLSDSSQKHASEQDKIESNSRETTQETCRNGRIKESGITSAQSSGLKGEKDVTERAEGDKSETIPNDDFDNDHDITNDADSDKKDGYKNDSYNDKNGNGKDINNDDNDDDDEEEEFEDYSEEMRGGVFTKEHGRLSHSVEITIDMGSTERGLKVTDDNADIIQDVKEKYKLIKSKYLNYVKRWLQVMTDCKAKSDEIKAMEALRSRLEEAVKKCLELDIISSSSSTSQRITDSDSEDDFEDVPEKEGYEEDVPEHIKLEAFSKASTSKKGKGRSKATQKKQYWMLPEDDDEDADDPTRIHLKIMAENSKTSKKSSVLPKLEPGTSKMSAVVSTPTPGCSKSSHSSSKSSKKDDKLVKGGSKEKLLEKAPVKSFGVDLEHWENPENIEAPLQVKYEGASRFWVPDKDAVESATQEQVAALTMRKMTYTGEFEPVKWKCRAPMPDGLLCERMDRKKCPFHGKIIPRDEIGQPTDPEDIEKLMKEDLTEADNEATSSTKGKSPVKGKDKGKAKKRKYPNLTDISVKKTSRERLESKIFKSSTLKRVNQVLDAADIKKATERFANQFNYSLK